MTKSWSEVAGSESFKQLPPEQQDGARRQYFDDVVAPKVPTNQRDVAWDQFSTDVGVGRRELPAGVAPSAAGGGRGSVNPGMTLDSARRPRASDAEIDTMLRTPVNNDVQQGQATVLEGMTFDEPQFDPAEAQRLSTRVNAENTPLPGQDRGPVMSPSTGPQQRSGATARGAQLQDASLPVRAAVKAFTGIGQGTGGVVRAVGDFTGSDTLSKFGADAAKAGTELDTAMGDTGSVAGFGPKSPVPYLSDMAEGATSSLAQSAAYASMFGAGAVIPLMSVMSAGEQYDKARNQGLDPAMALAGALPKGAFEAIGEKFSGLDKVAGAMGTILTKGASAQAKKTAAEVLIKSGIREIPGEVITYLGQTGVDLLPGIGLNPDLTMGQFVDGLRDTVVQAGMMGGAMGGGGAAVRSDPRIKRLRDAGETGAADLLQAKLDQQNTAASVDTELSGIAPLADFAATPEYQADYRALRTEGVKPVEAAGRSAVTSNFRTLATTTGMPQKAVDMALETAKKTGLDKLPGFFQRYTQALAKRGVIQAPQGADTLGTELEGVRDHAMNAAMGVTLQVDGGVRSTMAAVEDLESQQNPAAALETPAPAATETIAEPLPESAPVDFAAHEAATSPLNSLPEPTQAQKEAGNYKVGRVNLHGLNISIENPEGSTRSGVSPDGTAWENTLAAHYGYIRGTEGNDGDHVDTFIGPNPQSQKVFVIDQVNKDGSFDEHKVMLGVDSLEQADALYHDNYHAGWTGRGAITEMPLADFKAWVKDGIKTQPVGNLAGTNTEQSNVQNPPVRPSGATEAPAQAAPAQAGAPAGSQPEGPAAAGTDTGAPALETPRVILGRNNVPMAEGGKAFKTRRAADDARKLQPMMRVIRSDGGYALTEKTPAQLAAQERAAQRLRNPQTSPPGQPIPAHAMIAAAGGLHPDTRADMGMEGNVKIGNRSLFAGEGKGLTIERATEKLIEEGYLPEGAGHDQARALIKRSLTQPQYTAEGFERMAEAETQARFDAAMTPEEAIDDAVAQIEALSDNQFDALDDLDIPDFDAASNTTLEAAMRDMGFTDQEIQDAITDQSRIPGSDSESRGGPVESAAAEAQADPGSRDEAPGEPEKVSLPAATQTPADAGVSVSGVRSKLEGIAERLGVQVFKSAGGWHATGGMVMIPDADVDSQGMVEPLRVFAHELGHVIMQKREVSFRRFPKSEVLKWISNWEDLQAASKAFRPDLHKSTNERFRRHAVKPDEVIADAIGAVLMGKQPMDLLAPLREKFGLTDRDFGLEPQAPAAASSPAATPALESKLRTDGTLAITGDAKAIRKLLAAIPAKSLAGMKGGILVGRTQADKAAAILRGEKPKLTAREAAEAGQAAREAEKKAKAAAARAKPAAGGLTVGIMPGNAEPVTVRDGIVYIGKAEALDFDNGEPVRVKDGASDAEIVNALKVAGALSRRQRVFGLVDEKLNLQGNRVDETANLQEQGLTAPTKEDVLAQQQAKEDGAKAESKAATESENKAKADAERNEFTLTGSDRPADVGAAGGQDSMFARAYHGSPHNFERFSTDNIGTGEGAQAYGWGLYFTESKGIAEGYHKSLSLKVAHVNGEVPERGTLRWEAANMIASKGYDEALAQATKSSEFKFLTPAGREQAAKVRDEIVALKDAEVKDKASGGVYQVDVPDEAVDNMLLWDKPLSEQPKAVREALAKIDPDTYAPDGGDYDANEQGQITYQRMMDMSKTDAQDRGWSSIVNTMNDSAGSPKAASMLLAKAGIPGIKYLDGNSRNRPLRDVKREFLAELPEDAGFDEVLDLLGDGTFSQANEKIIKALAADDWLGFDYPAQALSTALGGKLSEFDASDALVKAVADAQVDATYNLVVFDDSIVELTHKDGSPVTKAERSEYLQPETAMARQGFDADAFSRMFSPPSAMSVSEVQKAVDQLTSKWKSGPTIKVVATPADLPIDAPADARGLIQGDTAYIVARNHVNRDWVAKTLGHEAIGHYGLWRMLGDDGTARFNRNLQLALKSGNVPLNKLRDKVRAAYVDGKGKFNLSASEESSEIAAFAVEDAIDPATGEFKPGFGFVKEVYAKVAEFLRSLGISIKFTNSELHGMLVSAMRGLKAGKRLDGGGQVMVAAARDGHADAATVLLQLGQREDLFQMPRSNATDLAEIAEAKGLTVAPVDRNSTDNKLWMLANTTPADGPGVQSWIVTLPNGKHGTLTNAKGQVYINVSSVGEGNRGNAIYDLAANYAMNNGLQFIGDPNGVSPAAMRRRLENMLSSAVKYGTTNHLAPHPDQLEGNKAIGVPALKWTDGDTVGNMNAMVAASVAATDASNPVSTSNVHFDAATQSFRDGDNNRLDDASLSAMLGFDGRDTQAGSAGRATLQRNALFRALLQSEGARRAVLEQLRDERSGGSTGTGDGLKGTFYARGNQPSVDGTDRSAFARGTGNLFQPNIWSMPDATRTDRVIYELQDGKVDLKRAQEAIKASGQAITEKYDARLAETLYPGRVAYRSATFLDVEAKPLLEAMARNKVGMNELADYLHARGAEERNAQIAKVNPNMPDGGAGTNTKGELMTDQAARDYLAAVNPARKVVLDAMARRVDTITAGTRALLVAEGLEKQETIDAWEGAYKNYVPMFRDEAETAMPPHPQGAGFQVKGSASKRATGSTKEVTNILAHVLMQREAAITRAEKNRVALALYGQALSHPNPDFWTTIKPSMDAAQIADELVAMGVDPMTAEVGMEGVPTIRTVDPITQKVVDRPNPIYRNLPGAIPLKVNGADRVLMLNVKTERGQRLATSLKNLDGLTQLDIAGHIIGKSTRWLAAVNTQYNPAFGLVNLTRDTLGGAINLGSTELRGNALKVLAKTPLAILGIARELASGGQTGTWQSLYRQFQADGGQTGWKESFRDPNDRAKAVEKELAALGRTKLSPGRAAHAILDLLDGFNTTLENAVRLSAYKAALDKGISRAEAARLGRELTVDFNRKGRAGREVGPLYAFFNASVQGGARTIQALKGPTGGRIIAGGISLGILQALMLAAADYDDDEIPEFVKTRALIIPLFGREKKYISIPYPLGLHVLPNTGRVLAELTLNGGKDIAKRSVAAIGEIAGAFNPLGGGNIFTADGALKTVAPTTIDPLIEIGFNRNFAGGTIEKTGYGGETDNRPGVARVKESTQRTVTGQAYMGISKAINTLTGGTDYEAGVLSPTPERVRYIAQTVGGGVLREFEKTINSSTAAVRGEKVRMSGIPVAGRFYGEVDDDQAQTSRYFNSARTMRKIESSVKAATKAGDLEAADKIEDRNPEAALIRTFNRTQRAISALNKEAVQTIGDREEMVQIDKDRAQLMREFNEDLAELERESGKVTLADRLKKATKPMLAEAK